MTGPTTDPAVETTGLAARSTGSIGTGWQRRSTTGATPRPARSSRRRNALPWPPAGRTVRRSGSWSTWHSTASDAASTDTSPIPCPASSPSCERRSIRRCRHRQPLERALGRAARFPGGARGLRRALPCGGPGAGRRRCCCSTAKATTTACTRTCTANMSFRCRGGPAVAAGRGFHRRRVRADRAAAAHAVAGRSGAARAGRRGDFAVNQRPVQRHARRLPGNDAARRQPAARRAALTLGIIFHDAA